MSFFLTELHVLLVEDDEDDAYLIRELLTGVEGGRYHLHWESTFEAGLEAIQGREFDACLLDHRLGARTGLEFLQEVSRMETPPPCILLTGAATREIDVAAMRAGAADFLDKADLTDQLLDRALRYSVRDRQASQSQVALLEERAARIEAEASNQAKSQFIAKLSHELRTPLTPALAILNRLDADPKLATRYRDALEIVRRNVEQEVYLIDDLLDLTRIERGSFKLAKESIDIARILASVLVDQRNGLRETKSLDIRLLLRASSHETVGDPHRLTQVFNNLIGNAVKFTPDGGKIVIQTSDEPESEAIAISVRDSGPGIEAKNLSTIFEAFEQRHDLVDPTRGLGLGLAIAKAFVIEHDGELRAYSSGLGTGATFEVILPLVPLEQADTKPEQPRAAEAPKSLGTILLVEDHEDSRVALRELLEMLDFGVLEAGSVDEALSKAADDDSGQATFDLLISDLDLGGGSGLDLMRKLGERFQKPGIALSGFGTQSDVERSLEAGFSAHLTKPITLDELQQTIATVAQNAELV